jgi:hypothetical protein
MAFLPRSNHLLISWLQSPSAMILEPKKRKSVTTFTFSLNHNGGFIFQLSQSFLIYFDVNLSGTYTSKISLSSWEITASTLSAWIFKKDPYVIYEKPTLNVKTYISYYQRHVKRQQTNKHKAIWRGKDVTKAILTDATGIGIIRQALLNDCH